MSLLIKGLEMPKDGECIVVLPDGTAYKYKPGDVVMYGDAYNEMAYASELPPHGRLGDLDALWDRAFDVYGTDADEHDTNIFLSMINGAETIIEAEGSGTDGT